jgi:hypothetical protein
MVHKTTQSLILTIFIIATISWTAIIAGFCSWSVNNEVAQNSELAKYQSRAFFQEIVATRYWNANHGSVYVPITSETQPNPYLDGPDRDVVTENGLKLTQINPAYMTRQIGEITAQKNSVWFHITSSNPLRPANAPDPWESVALKFLSTGSQEYSELITAVDGEKLFRYMAPLWVEAPCLKCHAKQGYKEGDLRGGISVTIKADSILAIQGRATKNLTYAYGSIWIVGLLGIFWGWRRLNSQEKKRVEIIDQLQHSLAEVKTLSGLLPICSHCKNVRDDKGYWNKIEAYIRDHSEAEFSHGICPECAKKYYPDYNLYGE